MIPRYQRILFYSLLGGIILMAVFLFYERKRMHDRLTAHDDATPLAAPVDTATEPYTLDLASDVDGSVTAVQRQIALPQEPSVKARALLERLMAEYALPKSKHPLASGAAVDDVFLLNLPITSQVAASSLTNDAEDAASTPMPAAGLGRDGQIAVINLRGSFVNDHPSGADVEMLTVLSILGTLHANFAQIAQVRFLVDGQPRETLAGHADLLRVYPAIDTAVGKSALQPLGEGAGEQP